LQRCIKGVMSVAEDWARAACVAKGIDPDSSLAGEEWLVGAAATLVNLQLLIKTLRANGQPRPGKVSRRSSDQLVAQVFPDNWLDRLLWFGFRGEVWLEPGKPATQGMVYRQKPDRGQVSLVLGAGNISSIAPMDVLYKLFAEDQVVLLKMNPVNEYMGNFLEQAFQPLIADGFLQIVYGGAELGNYLCHHAAIATIHITGSHHTHDAIVWGHPRQAQPVLTKPITSELGCVTPILVVPGEWSQADIQFQARSVASMVAHNASFNCVAAKVVITANGWQQRQAFLTQLHQELAKIPSRKAYYPGAQQRYQAFLDRYPQAKPLASRTEDVVPWTVIPDVPAEADEFALNTEAFCGVLAEVSLDAVDAKTFLAEGVAVANDKIWGNLSCVLLIDPKTQKQVKAELEQAIAELRYGAIGINVWTAAIYSLCTMTWGAFSGNPLENIQSGRGVVHNTYFFEHPQKSVLRAPFRVQPDPLWFANQPNLLAIARRFTEFQAAPSLSRFVKLILATFKKS
jgi:Aldehyde dehydrogenase family